MAIVKSGICLLLVFSSVWPLAVEFDLDGPLDMKKSWKFLRRENFFLQHQCGSATAKRLADTAAELLEAKKITLGKQDTEVPLQIRLFANAQVYRNTVRVSQERQAHYNAQINLVAAHCGVTTAVLDEQLTLYYLAKAPLRPWQKVFIAEVMLSVTGNRGTAFFPDVNGTKPVELRYVMLSNHIPGKSERATLRRIAQFLQKHDKLAEFVSGLAQDRGFDDTGLTVLEKLFPEGLGEIEKYVNKALNPPVSNNTLRNYKK